MGVMESFPEPAEKIEHKWRGNWNHNHADYWKVEAHIIALDPDIARQTANPGQPSTIGKYT